MKITLYNNSCFLVSTEKINILVDPFLKRKQLNNLGFDYGLISHAHIDHMMHAQTIKKPIIAPRGLHFKTGDRRITSNMTIEDLSIHTTKAYHPRWFQKGLLYNAIQSFASVHRFVYCKENYGFVFSDGVDVVYYSGDTLFNEKLFTEIKEKYNPSLCLISFEGFQLPTMKLLSHFKQYDQIQTIFDCPVVPVHQTTKWYDSHLYSYLHDTKIITYEKL